MDCELTALVAWHIAALEAQAGGAVKHHPGEQEDYALSSAGRAGIICRQMFLCSECDCVAAVNNVPTEYDSWMTRAGLSERSTGRLYLCLVIGISQMLS